MQGTAQTTNNEKITSWITLDEAINIDWNLYVLEGVRKVSVEFYTNAGNLVNVLRFQNFVDAYNLLDSAIWPCNHATADVIAWYPNGGPESVANWTPMEGVVAVWDDTEN